MGFFELLILFELEALEYASLSTLFDLSDLREFDISLFTVFNIRYLHVSGVSPAYALLMVKDVPLFWLSLSSIFDKCCAVCQILDCF